jgi:hypothetical protein
MFSSVSATTIYAPEAAIGWIFAAAMVSKCCVPGRTVPARAIVLARAIVREIAPAPAIVAAIARARATVPAEIGPIVPIRRQASKAREETAPRPPTVRAVARAQAVAVGATPRSGTYLQGERLMFKRPAADRVLPAPESRPRVSVAAPAAAEDSVAVAFAAVVAEAAVAAAAAPTLR